MRQEIQRSKVEAIKVAEPTKGQLRSTPSQLLLTFLCCDHRYSHPPARQNPNLAPSIQALAHIHELPTTPLIEEAVAQA